MKDFAGLILARWLAATALIAGCTTDTARRTEPSADAKRQRRLRHPTPSAANPWPNRTRRFKGIVVTGSGKDSPPGDGRKWTSVTRHHGPARA